MHFFYCPNIKNSIVQLPPDESVHCIKVLRLRKGDTINLTDGKGTVYEAVITTDNPKACTVEISHKLKSEPGPTYSIHMAIAPTKSATRFEWFLEKSVELGIDIITPLICKRSERNVLKPDRLRKLLISSMKQALVPVLPVLQDMIDFKDFLHKTENSTAQKFIGHCNIGKKKSLNEVYIRGSNTILLIGPEGDFTHEEVDLATVAGYIPVSLSNNRLRTETAGIAACHAIHVLNT